MSNSFDQITIQSLSGVGPRVAGLLKKLDILTVWDLLLHLPFRYEDRSKITPIQELTANQPALIEGNIQALTVSGKQRSQLVCQIADETGSIQLRFIHFHSQQKQQLQTAGKIRCYGELRGGFLHEREMIHPEYQIVDRYYPPLPQHLVPVYPATKGLSQWQIRKLTSQALAILEKAHPACDDLPQTLCDQLHFPLLKESLQWLHHPPAHIAAELFATKLQAMRQRLAFEELLVHQLGLHHLRQEIHHHQAPSLQSAGKLRHGLENNLPFQLTRAQQRVIDEIIEDLKQARPMLRLIQGDVGSGKTIVAAMAMLEAVECGYQAALMAPTELLAEQHRQNFKNWLEPLGIKVNGLSGSMPARLREETLERMRVGEDQVIIGTHALFQEQVIFHRLGLLVVDEQHRFGVEQRLTLMKKGVSGGYFPHQLIMTATPIPRTLAMVAYADLDCSVIDEIPPGRKPVQTIVVSNHRRVEVIERVQVHCESKKQAYWVCTLIEESEVLQCQAAEITTKELQQALPHLKIALVHGRLKPDEKEQIMGRYKKGEIDLLVSTTVIEVGVDVANASLMVIENSERLGLAQLHQLRGRVGRGSEQSYCVLLYQNPLSQIAKKRLQVLRSTQDGFEIARQDLEIRGPGEVLGVRQAGLMHLRVADLLRDQELLPEVQKISAIVLRDHPEIMPGLFRRWLRKSEEHLRI